MKTYKVIFDGYIDNIDLEKMITNEYGRSASLVRSTENGYGGTEAVIEFDDNIPYEVIELMTDGNVVVEMLILENSKLKESIGSERDAMIDSLTDFMRMADMAEFLTVIIESYAEIHNLTFKDSVSQLSKNMNNFLEDAFKLHMKAE